MSEKENLRWTIVGLVVGGSISILYDIFQKWFSPTENITMEAKLIASFISLGIGIGLVLFFFYLKKQN